MFDQREVAEVDLFEISKSILMRHVNMLRRLRYHVYHIPVRFET